MRLSCACRCGTRTSQTCIQIGELRMAIQANLSTHRYAVRVKFRDAEIHVVIPAVQAATDAMRAQGLLYLNARSLSSWARDSPQCSQMQAWRLGVATPLCCRPATALENAQIGPRRLAPVGLLRPLRLGYVDTVARSPYPGARGRRLPRRRLVALPESAVLSTRCRHPRCISSASCDHF